MCGMPFKENQVTDYLSNTKCGFKHKYFLLDRFIVEGKIETDIGPAVPYLNLFCFLNQ